MDDFEIASIKALGFLRRKLGFQLCMVTRTEGDDWTVLHSDDHGYGVTPGDVFNWQDSFCSEMVKGNGPFVAPDSSLVPAYAAAEIGRKIPIGTYIGVPLSFADGRLFGTLCGIDPNAQPPGISESQELLELVGDMLSRILRMELRVDEEQRRTERYQARAMSDDLTGFYNGAGWVQLLAKEEARYQRYRQSSVVMAIDLGCSQEAGDERAAAVADARMVRAASALRQVLREEDVVARLGRDSVGIIGINRDKAAGMEMYERVQAALARVGVQACCGFAVTSKTIRIAEALALADRAMYAQRRQKSIGSV